jgi:hypothetical protein
LSEELGVVISPLLIYFVGDYARESDGKFYMFLSVVS